MQQLKTIQCLYLTRMFGPVQTCRSGENSPPVVIHQLLAPLFDGQLTSMTTVSFEMVYGR